MGIRAEYLDKIVNAVLFKSASICNEESINKLAKIFDGIIKYYPEECNEILIKHLQKFADNCKNSSAFSLAEKYYAMVLAIDNMKHEAYWGLLQAKLNCRNNDDLIKQHKKIADLEDFSSVIAASASDERAADRYASIAKKQIDYQEEQRRSAAARKRKKRQVRILSLVAVFVAVIALSIFSGIGYYKTESALKYVENETGYTVLGGKYFKETNVIIPAEYNGKQVTKIDDNAFSGNTHIETITLPTTIIEIGNSAFKDCVSLKLLRFDFIKNTAQNEIIALALKNENGEINATNLKKIGVEAFYNCKSLETIDLQGVEIIDARAFYGCAKLRSVTIPETIQSVGERVFAKCDTLEKIIIEGAKDDLTGFADDWKDGLSQNVKITAGFKVKILNEKSEIIDSVVVEYGEEYVISPINRDGYTFLGWILNSTEKLTNEKGESLQSYNYKHAITVQAQWEANVNIIIFEANGGVGAMENQRIATDGTAKLNKCIFTRVGYTFIGWGTTSTEKVYDDAEDYKMGTKSQYRLFAIWQANTNTLHFNANGGTGEMKNAYIRTDDSATLPRNLFEKKGYDFAGWAESAEGKVVYADQSVYKMDVYAENVLYAQWKIVTYKINYNLNGGQLAVQNKATYNIETSTFTLNNPTKRGYKFTGWSGSNLMGNENQAVFIETGSYGELTFTANWTAIEYSITYNLNEGTNNSANPKTYTIEQEVRLQDPERKGYKFSGWTDNGLISKGSIGEKTFTASWEIIEYNVIYNLEGGINDSSNPTKYNVKTPKITLKAPTKLGYKFIEWTNGGIIENGSTGEKSFTAKWEIVTYKITYNLDGGTNNKNNPATYNVHDNITLAEPTKIGYKFIGWSDNGKIPVNSTGDKVFTANWEIIDYKITYVLNGGFNNSKNPKTYNINDEKIELLDPVRPGYTFGGWANGGIIPAHTTGDITFSAFWTANQNTLKFDANGGIGSLADATMFTDETKNLPDNTFQKKGYEFKGWAMTVDGSVQYLNLSAYTMGPNSETTLYAVWSLIIYKIDYNLNNGVEDKNPTEYSVETESFSLVTPQREGYTFTGWSGTDINGQLVSVTIEKSSIGNRSYTANWKANLNVVMISDGINTIQVTGHTDEYVRLPENTFEKANHEFKGWATAQDGEVEYYDRDLYLVGPKSSYTLYAVWEGSEVIDRTDWTSISTVEELDKIRNNLSGKYYLVCDLDMDGYKWTPIGSIEHGPNTTTDNSFKGVFDGNGYIIYNFNLNEKFIVYRYKGTNKVYSYTYGCGLFGYNKGTITNVKIYGSNIKCDIKFSSLTGNANTINNWYAKIGLICSMNSGIVQDCYAQGSISFSSNFAVSNENLFGYNYFRGASLGGVSGDNYKILNCSADVSITSNVNSKIGYIEPDTENINSLIAEKLFPWDEWYIKYACQNGTYRYQFAKWHSIVKALESFENKDGYTFIGWALSNGGSVKYRAGDECFIPLGKNSLTLYPVWQANTNKVIFNSNGGSGEMPIQQIQTNVTAKLSDNAFTRIGYHFLGWATSPEGQVEFADKDDYTMGANSSYNLYAVWEKNTNEIVFKANGGSGTMENQQALTNTIVTLNECTVTAPTGYYFAGWSEEPDGNADYLDCSSFPIGTSDTYTLYAIWKKI